MAAGSAAAGGAAAGSAAAGRAAAGSAAAGRAAAGKAAPLHAGHAQLLTEFLQAHVQHLHVPLHMPQVLHGGFPKVAVD